MSRTTGFSSPLLLGFDEIERLVDRVSKASDGYPPYNIERLAATSIEPMRIRIVLAVAGFAEPDLEILVEENELSVTGRQSDADDRDYLHRGIAARQFRRTFVLADGMQVKGASLDNGLLAIELSRPEAARMVRQVPITSRG